jgi:Domain of unknown function (DUF2017)
VALLQGIRRLPGGRYRIRLTTRERDLLRSLPDQLRPLLSGERDLDTGAGWIRGRLFPAAYDDPVDELEYRELVGTSVTEDRLAAVEDFARTLDGGTTRMGMWSAVLTTDEADAWLSALNDARLTLAMVAGITDESAWTHGPDRTDPTSIALYYLGWLQEELLAALMGTLEDHS